MKKYDEYKDSGVAWIGEVPKHWEVIKLKYKYHFQTGATPNTGKKENFEGDLRWANISDLNGSVVYDTTKHINKEAASKCSMNISPKGSLMYSFKLSVGTVAFCGEDMYTNEAIASFIPQKNDLKYLFYCAPIFIIHNANRNIYNAPLLNQELIKNALICLPSLNEQTAIATYLDTHCAKIDNLISIQQKRIVLLQELKQSVITHAVTKGLNPNVEMKQSGVEWIGDVPKHWEVCKLKHYSQVVLGKMLMTSPPKDSEGLYTLEKYLKSKNVGWLQLFLDEDNIDEMWFNQYEKSIYKLQENDIVMNEGGDIGKVSCWRGVDFDCYIQNSINKITADYNRVNAGFLCYWLYNLSSLGYFWSIVSQISIAHLTKEKLSNSPVVLPPITEQAAIASYLDHKCATIDTSISNAQHQIDLLQEYKQSLITEVVTGKRKVTDN